VVSIDHLSDNAGGQLAGADHRSTLTELLFSVLILPSPLHYILRPPPYPQYPLEIVSYCVS
jgi:hypothetical protein